MVGLLRGLWEIENGLHWVRDGTCDEDCSQVSTAAAPTRPSPRRATSPSAPGRRAHRLTQHPTLRGANRRGAAALDQTGGVVVGRLGVIPTVSDRRPAKPVSGTAFGASYGG